MEVNEAPTFRRYRARAKGRGTRIIKAQQPHHYSGGRRIVVVELKVIPVIRLGNE